MNDVLVASDRAVMRGRLRQLSTELGDEVGASAGTIADTLAQLASVHAALAGKADSGSLGGALDAIATLQASIAGKASAADLATAQATIGAIGTAMAGKASSAALATLQAAVDGKASTAALSAVQGTLATVQADLATRALQADLAALQAAVAAIAPLGTFTVATLPTAAAGNLGRIATVTDLFGNRYSRVRCERVTSAGYPDLYFWQPLSSDSAGSMAMTANTTIRPLTSPTTIDLTGALLAGVVRTLTLDPTGGWPGAIKEVRSDVTLGLAAGLNIAGLGLGSAVSLLTGGYRKFVLEYTGGALAWRQLV